MMNTYYLLAVTALVTFALAAPGTNLYNLHERRDESSNTDQTKRLAVDPDFVLPMRIGLTQSNLDLGYHLLMEVSDPKSPKYGQHYTAEEVWDIFAPSSEAVAAVHAWLEDAGIDSVSQSINKQWLQFDAPAWKVEDLLRTKFYSYANPKSSKVSISCNEYYVRADIQHHIDYITPGVKAHAVHSADTKRARLKSVRTKRGPRPIQPSASKRDTFALDANFPACNTSGISPACVQQVYNFTTGSTAVAGNQLGIVALNAQNIPEELYQPDFNSFFTLFATRIPNGTFPSVKLIDGAVQNSQYEGDESMLDCEMAYPIIYPQNEVLFLTDSLYESSLDKPGFMNDFLDAIDGSYCTYSAYGETGNNNTVDDTYPSQGYEHPLQCGTYNATNVISLSYAVAEFGSGLASNYEMRQCNEYMKLGMQGITIVVGSGDFGVASNYDCQTVNKHAVFNAQFPASCPYVTSVGETNLTGTAGNLYEAAAWTAYEAASSGGGFSNFFARPAYQATAVKNYFASPQAPNYPYYTGSTIGAGFYNRSGRGFPDVSALGFNMAYHSEGYLLYGFGTSFATPIFAAILNRINEQRLLAKKSVIGFVNPVLYANPSAFNDITVGSNIGTQCNGYGFKTATGWDPVTGLGTPKYYPLSQAFMSLQ